MRDPSPIAANDDTPLDLVRAIRRALPDLDRAEIGERLYRVEQTLQRRMTVLEAAGLTGEKPGTLYQAIARGHLPAKLEGPSNRPLISASDLAAWADRPRRRRDGSASP